MPSGAAGEGREKAWLEHFATNKHKTFLNEPKMVYNYNFLTFYGCQLVYALLTSLPHTLLCLVRPHLGVHECGGKGAHESPHATSPSPMGGELH